jgi:hypothetical protein
VRIGASERVLVGIRAKLAKKGMLGAVGIWILSRINDLGLGIKLYPNPTLRNSRAVRLKGFSFYN